MQENPEGHWRKYAYDEIVVRDKSFADLGNLSDPDLLAGEIIENLEAGLASFQEICAEYFVTSLNLLKVRHYNPLSVSLCGGKAD